VSCHGNKSFETFAAEYSAVIRDTYIKKVKINIDRCFDHREMFLFWKIRNCVVITNFLYLCVVLLFFKGNYIFVASIACKSDK
jgi:hypothetical protein